MHVVRVDQPTDDGIADFLVVDKNAIDLVPNWIYVSDNGTHPLRVTIGNITNISYTSSKSIQVSSTIKEVIHVYPLDIVHIELTLSLLSRFRNSNEI
jgi:hypothetical protein